MPLRLDLETSSGPKGKTTIRRFPTAPNSARDKRHEKFSRGSRVLERSQTSGSQTSRGSKARAFKRKATISAVKKKQIHDGVDQAKLEAFKHFCRFNHHLGHMKLRVIADADDFAAFRSVVSVGKHTIKKPSPNSPPRLILEEDRFTYKAGTLRHIESMFGTAAAQDQLDPVELFLGALAASCVAAASTNFKSHRRRLNGFTCRTKADMEILPFLSSPYDPDRVEGLTAWLSERRARKLFRQPLKCIKVFSEVHESMTAKDLACVTKSMRSATVLAMVLKKVEATITVSFKASLGQKAGKFPTSKLAHYMNLQQEHWRKAVEAKKLRKAQKKGAMPRRKKKSRPVSPTKSQAVGAMVPEKQDVRRGLDSARLNFTRESELQETRNNVGRTLCSFEAFAFYGRRTGCGLIKIGEASVGDKPAARPGLPDTFPFGAWKEMETAYGMVNPTDGPDPAEIALGALAADIARTIAVHIARLEVLAPALTVRVRQVVNPRVAFGIFDATRNKHTGGALDINIICEDAEMGFKDRDNLISMLKELALLSPLLQMYINAHDKVTIAEPVKGVRQEAEFCLKEVLPPQFPGWIDEDVETEKVAVEEDLKDAAAPSRGELAQAKEESIPETQTAAMEDIYKTEWSSNFKLHRSAEVSKNADIFFGKGNKTWSLLQEFKNWKLQESSPMGRSARNHVEMPFRNDMFAVLDADALKAEKANEDALNDLKKHFRAHAPKPF